MSRDRPRAILSRNGKQNAGQETTMNPDAPSQEKFTNLSPEAKAFLSKIDSDDVELLKDGLNLIKAIKTVSMFVKWLIISSLGVFFGTVMFWESVIKVMKLWRGIE